MRNCNKGYSCGATCINREKSCTKELTGQSIELVSSLASLISDRPVNKVKAKETSKASFQMVTDKKKLGRDFSQQWLDYDYDTEAKDTKKSLRDDSRLMRKVFENVFRFNSGNVQGAYDESGRLQGLIKTSLKGDSVVIDDLMTAPWNISKDDERKARGAGTELLKEAARGSQGGVYLYALSSAKAFYKKVGFKKIAKDSELQGVYNMQLSAADKKALLEAK